jgi:hypothetical protein
MNDLLAHNLSPTSFLLYLLVAGPAVGCVHYGARRLLGRLGRVIARLMVLALVIGALALIWKTGLLDSTHITDRAGVSVQPISFDMQ